MTKKSRPVVLPSRKRVWREFVEPTPIIPASPAAANVNGVKVGCVVALAANINPANIPLVIITAAKAMESACLETGFKVEVVKCLWYIS